MFSVDFELEGEDPTVLSAHLQRNPPLRMYEEK